MEEWWFSVGRRNIIDNYEWTRVKNRKVGTNMERQRRGEM